MGRRNTKSKKVATIEQFSPQLLTSSAVAETHPPLGPHMHNGSGRKWSPPGAHFESNYTHISHRHIYLYSKRNANHPTIQCPNEYQMASPKQLQFQHSTLYATCHAKRGNDTDLQDYTIYLFIIQCKLPYLNVIKH